MAHQQDEQPFTGFGLIPATEDTEGVFILAIYRDSDLSASAHATERRAMEAAVEYLEDELHEEDGTLEDLFARSQRLIADEGGIMQIIHSPIHGS